ncbi:MAG: hypothetical protein HF312_15635 [Ignavibacteria bacterium]|jgi:hypothetical protein|nr:hypothetical protein [Ignavibacteria bacterium]
MDEEYNLQDLNRSLADGPKEEAPVKVDDDLENAMQVIELTLAGTHNIISGLYTGEKPPEDLMLLSVVTTARAL